MQEVVIVAAGRSPVGSFNGALASLSGAQLGAQVLKSVLEQAGVQPDQVDEVILGQVLTAGVGQNPARQTTLLAGLPDTTPAMTINKVCGSGLKTVQLAAQAIATGDAEVVVAGGQESMSQSAHVLPRSRTGQRMGDWKLEDTMIKDGLWDAFNQYHMGVTAENLAEKYEISREEQDQLAATSQQRAEAAIKAGHFDAEIVPISVPQRKGDPVIVDRDEYPKSGVTAEGLGKLPAAFKREGGSVTAGNASGINDGAAILLVMSASKAESLGLKPIARIKAFASAGVDPAIMGSGPVPASRRCLERAGWSVDDLELVEANEAFAAQALAVAREMKWDMDKVNVNGGAIALGHPIGASGARVLVTLLHEMTRRDVHKGLATLCIGGGQGVALAVER